MASVAAEDHFATGLDPAARLYLRRKRPAHPEGSPVLMLHGSTLPGSLAFDLALDGRSWMDDLVAAGRDVWSLDLRGYGRSWKPPSVSRGDGTEEPIVDTEDAIADLTTAARYVMEATKAAAIDLIGWSWGATIVAAAASRQAFPIRRVVLHAPQWVRQTPSAMVTSEALNRSYREVDPEAVRRRWFLSLPDGPRAEVEARGWDGAFLDALKRSPDRRVPNGTIADNARFWNAGRAFYDPAAIAAPVRIIVGDADTDTPADQARALAALLPEGRSNLKILANATHFALLEPARDHLFAAASEFLTAHQTEV